MGKLLVLLLATAGVIAAPAQAPEPEPETAPDGLLVMGVVQRGGSGVHGEHAVVADPRTGRVRSRRLAGGTLCGGPVHAAGDRVVYSGYQGFRGEALSLPLTLTGPPRSLGRADTIAPSATPGRLWLGSHRRRDSVTTLREVGAAGDPTGGRTSGRLRRWAGIHAEVGGGFLIGSGNRLELWDRGLDRPLRSVRGGWPLAAGGSSVAFCRSGCSALGIWNDDGTHRLRPPGGVRLLGRGGAFSPGGELLATSVSRGGRSRLAVVELASGTWTLVPGGRLGVYEAMAWSPSGRWLYFTGAGKRLLGWPVGEARAVRLAIDLDGAVISIATAG